MAQVENTNIFNGIVIGCYGKFKSCGDMKPCTIRCPVDCHYYHSCKVYGTDTYTSESCACQAAIHAGRINASEGGDFTVYNVPHNGTFVGSLANEIQSFSKQKNFTTSYTFQDPSPKLGRSDFEETPHDASPHEASGNPASVVVPVMLVILLVVAIGVLMFYRKRKRGRHVITHVTHQISLSEQLNDEAASICTNDIINDDVTDISSLHATSEPPVYAVVNKKPKITPRKSIPSRTNSHSSPIV